MLVTPVAVPGRWPGQCDGHSARGCRVAQRVDAADAAERLIAGVHHVEDVVEIRTFDTIDVDQAIVPGDRCRSAADVERDSGQAVVAGDIARIIGEVVDAAVAVDRATDGVLEMVGFLAR